MRCASDHENFLFVFSFERRKNRQVLWLLQEGEDGRAEDKVST
jgi:hypothetical protein